MDRAVVCAVARADAAGLPKAYLDSLDNLPQEKSTHDSSGADSCRTDINVSEEK